MIPAEKQYEFDQLVNYCINYNKREFGDLLAYIEQSSGLMPSFHESFSATSLYGLFRPIKNWDTFEELLLDVLNKTVWHIDNFPPHLTSSFTYRRHTFIEGLLENEPTIVTEITILVKHGFTENEIWLALHNFNYSPFQNTYPSSEYIVNNSDKYLNLVTHSFGNSEHFIKRIMANKPEIFDKYIAKFMEGKEYEKQIIVELTPIKKEYLTINAEKHENYLVSLLSFKNESDDFTTKLALMLLIETNYPNKYANEIEAYVKQLSQFVPNRYRGIWSEILEHFLDVSEKLNLSKNAFAITGKYLQKNQGSGIQNIKIWLKKLKQYETAMTPNITENLWLFARHADKSVRQLTAQHIAKTLGETAIPEAETMLSDKKAEVRLTGALILSLIKTEKATAILRGCIADEMNDEVRNAMLEGVSTYLVENATIESIAESVLAAQKRGKLAKPVTPWLVNYPQLTYKNSDNHVDSDVIAFLFYRMSQTKDIRTDFEARPLLSLIDRETSAPFAKWLLDSYFQNGADAKLKWCLTLGAVLGGDNEIAFLQRNIVSFVDNNRGKMAENVVKALALQGSQRALRAVEFFSRKYKTKNKNIGAAALEAFDVAAEELNMTPYELADSVIPDFGFDGLFKEFDANNETYRAYIGNDFKLAFLDEDNKNLKALPKGTSAALKDEFKEIGKEIRDIVKSQSSRLEQYLVIQRRWTTDKWEGLFLTNPVMFIYAVRLIWGVFDEKNTLISVFRCQEDQSLTDKNGDEIDFNELKIKNSELKITENAVYTEGSFLELKVKNSEFQDGRLLQITNNLITNNHLQIGMVHPISLDTETIDFWKNDLLDNGIEAIFPQLNRRVIALEPMDKSVKMSDAFDGVEIGGYTFLSRMDKAGWVKGSIGDGGGILSYYKEFTEVGLVAIVMQTGNLSVSYYDVNAEIGNLMFVQKSGVRFGSYMYDEPSKMNDPRLVRFGDVPPIVYSEVMADMAFFKENQVK